MIIQLDFITNSSSTSSIFLVPKNFYVKNVDILKIVEEDFGDRFYDDEEVTREEFIQKTKECIERLKNSEIVNKYDYQHYFVVDRIFKEKDLVISTFESEDGAGVFIPITEKIVKQKSEQFKRKKRKPKDEISNNS
jgi:hypothetical protein